MICCFIFSDLFVWICLYFCVFEHPIFFGRPFADVGALQTAVMVDVWQRDCSLLSQVMSHYQHIKERKKERKAAVLATFTGYVPLSTYQRNRERKAVWTWKRRRWAPGVFLFSRHIENVWNCAEFLRIESLLDFLLAVHHMSMMNLVLIKAMIVLH